MSGYYTLKKHPVDNKAGKCLTSVAISHDARGSNKQPTDGIMDYQLIKDFGIPQECIEIVKHLRKLSRLRTAQDIRDFEEGVRLQIHFGGKDVVCLPSKEGTRIVGHGEPGSCEIQDIIDNLIDQHTQGIQIKSPEPWNWVDTQQEDFFLPTVSLRG